MYYCACVGIIYNYEEVPDLDVCEDFFNNTDLVKNCYSIFTYLDD